MACHSQIANAGNADNDISRSRVVHVSADPNRAGGVGQCYDGALTGAFGLFLGKKE